MRCELGEIDIFGRGGVGRADVVNVLKHVHIVNEPVVVDSAYLYISQPVDEDVVHERYFICVPFGSDGLPHH